MSVSFCSQGTQQLSVFERWHESQHPQPIINTSKNLNNFYNHKGQCVNIPLLVTFVSTERMLISGIMATLKVKSEFYEGRTESHEQQFFVK